MSATLACIYDGLGRFWPYRLIVPNNLGVKVAEGELGKPWVSESATVQTQLVLAGFLKDSEAIYYYFTTVQL